MGDLLDELRALERARGRVEPSVRSEAQLEPSTTLPLIFRAYDRLLGRSACGTGLLVDGEHRLLHVVGEGHRYLQFKEGRPNLDVLDLLPPSLAVSLGGALHEALALQQTVRFGARLEGASLEIEVWPLLEGDNPLAFIGFHADELPILQTPKRVDPAVLERARVAGLERALEESRAREARLHDALLKAEEEARRLEAARLEEAKARARAVDDLQDLTATLNTPTVFLDGLFCVRGFTPEATQIFELYPQSVGLPLRSIVARVDHGAVTQAIRAVFSGRAPRFEIELLHDDERWLRLHVTPQRMADGAIEGLVLAFEDITAQRRAEASAGSSMSVPSSVERRPMELLTKLPFGVALVQRDGQRIEVLEVNPAATALGGVSVDADGADPDATRYALSQAILHKVQVGFRSRRATQYDVKGALDQPLRLQVMPQGSNRAILVFESLSEDRHDREQMVSAQRMEAIGQVAGGLAHELNNMLSVILMSAELSREELEGANLPLGSISTVLETSNRAADLVAHLLTFSRRRPIKPSVTDLPSFIQAKRPVLRGVLGPTIQLDVHTERQPDPIYIDSHALEQALIHLASNARRACPEGGQVEIRLSSVKNPTIRGVTRPGRFSRLVFSDNGDGMDEQTQQRCFEPFFTRSSRGIGSGLGLSMVEGVVTQADGLIALRSTLGQGTSFSLYLPAADDARMAELLGGAEPSPSDTLTAKVTAPSAPPAPGKVKILLVEDERALRLVLVRQIKRLGYEVVEASSGEEALSVFTKTPDIDLVLSDVIMPGINGPTLARRLRALQPDLKIVLMSGYTEHAGVQNTVLELGLPFISKPFTRRFLAFTLERILKPPAKTEEGEVTPTPQRVVTIPPSPLS